MWIKRITKVHLKFTIRTIIHEMYSSKKGSFALIWRGNPATPWFFGSLKTLQSIKNTFSSSKYYCTSGERQVNSLIVSIQITGRQEYCSNSCLGDSQFFSTITDFFLVSCLYLFHLLFNLQIEYKSDLKCSDYPGDSDTWGIHTDAHTTFIPCSAFP